MAPERTRIDVWVLDLRQAVEGDHAWLCAAERDAAARLRNGGAEWLKGRLALRRILAEQSGIPPARLAFRPGPFGKPELTDGSLHFNLSHSGPILAVAVCREGPVGIDVEAERTAPELQAAMLRWVLTRQEHAQWARLPQEQRAAALLRVWRRKEALLKGLGFGLTIPPRTVHVGCGANAEPVVWETPWRLYDLPLPPPYGACVAGEGNFHDIRIASAIQ